VKRVAVGAALLCLATACATAVPRQRLSASDPRPRQLLDQWVDGASQRQRLRGIARLAVDRDDEAAQLRGKQLVVLERPARMRVEILGFLNQSLAVITTDGEHFEMYSAEDHRYESGDADENWLWKEAGIDLSPEAAVAVLLGVPPSEPLPALASAVRDAEGRIGIDLADSRGVVVQRATFDLSGRLRVLEALDATGAVVWSAHYDQYRDVDGSPFAHWIGLDVRSGNTRAEISFRNVELNPDLPPGLFELFQIHDGRSTGADGR